MFCSFVGQNVPADKKADCTLTMSDADLQALMTGKLNPQTVRAPCLLFQIINLIQDMLSVVVHMVEMLIFLPQINFFNQLDFFFSLHFLWLEKTSVIALVRISIFHDSEDVIAALWGASSLQSLWPPRELLSNWIPGSFFFNLRSLAVSSVQAFFQGKLKISGNMGMAMKLQNLQVKPAKAKLWRPELLLSCSPELHKQIGLNS